MRLFYIIKNDSNTKMIGIILGTRPEVIKCLPFLDMSDRFVPIFVLQQTDLLSDYITSTSLQIPVQTSGTTRLNDIVLSILSSTLFKEYRFSALMVQGDTAVAFGAALVAFHNNIPLIHLEAGLRTYNNCHPWPEEGYRKMIDCIAQVALCPSVGSYKNLQNEKYIGEAHIVGNTSIDVISKYNLQPTIGNTVLITLHRRENWHQIPAFFAAIETLAERFPTFEFVIPVHPNPEIRREAQRIFKKVCVIEPLQHSEMCSLLAQCNCVISDSGGIQEEASYLGKRVFCCRETTERDELLDTYLTMTPTPSVLLSSFSPQTELLPCCQVYGTGGATAKIMSVLRDY